MSIVLIPEGRSLDVDGVYSRSDDRCTTFVLDMRLGDLRMAKRRQVRNRADNTPEGRRSAGSQFIRSAESRLEEFAEDLGRLLGTAKAKADGWLEQRQSIATQLSAIRETATDLLHQVTGGRANAIGRRGRVGSRKRRPGRPKGAGRKRRRMSAEARARIAEAQRRRWAKQRREQKKEQ